MPSLRRTERRDSGRGGVLERLDKSGYQLNPVLIVGLAGQPCLEPPREGRVPRCGAQDRGQPSADQLHGALIERAGDDVQFAQDIADAARSARPREVIDTVLDSIRACLTGGPSGRRPSWSAHVLYQ